MRLVRLLGHIYILASVLFLSACLNNDSVTEGDTEAVIVPVPGEDPRDPSSVVCDPFDTGAETAERTQGVIGSLYYLDATQPQYTSVNDYILNGHHVDEVDIYFNQLFIPTRPFDRGFVTQGGHTLVNEEGSTLYEWFALRFQGRIHLGPTDPEGDYELALLSDDGSIWRLDRDGDGSFEDVVNNDGQHGTRLGCTNEIINLKRGDKIPFQLDYNQGPRFHISLITLWRPWNLGMPMDTLCNKTSNTAWFDSTKDPPQPATWYIDLLTRGWTPLTPQNFSLPANEKPNPCNEPAPVITNFAATNVGSTSVTFTWTTSNAADSQIIAKDVVTNQEYFSTVNTQLKTSHTLTITGLKANTRYDFRAKSASISGRTTESNVLALKTAR